MPCVIEANTNCRRKSLRTFETVIRIFSCREVVRTRCYNTWRNRYVSRKIRVELMSSAYSQCSTVELLSHDMENGDGLEPPNRGFAVPRITNFATRSVYLTKKTHKLHKDFLPYFWTELFLPSQKGIRSPLSCLDKNRLDFYDILCVRVRQDSNLLLPPLDGRYSIKLRTHYEVYTPYRIHLWNLANHRCEFGLVRHIFLAKTCLPLCAAFD